MWAEAMGKLEGMESSDRERLWPQLVQGFKDLSHRLKVVSPCLVWGEEGISLFGWHRGDNIDTESQMAVELSAFQL